MSIHIKHVWRFSSSKLSNSSAFRRFGLRFRQLLEFPEVSLEEGRRGSLEDAGVALGGRLWVESLGCFGLWGKIGQSFLNRFSGLLECVLCSKAS